MEPNKSGIPGQDTEQPFLSHLMELRDRLLRSVIVVAAIFFVLMPFADRFFSILAGPLNRHLPEQSTMIAIEVAAPFLVPFKLALVLSIFIAMPYLLHQLWAFVAPGLYRHERRLVFPLLLSSTLLFYLGAAFAYFVVFPVVFGFFTGAAPEGVAVMTDIGKYLDFVLTMFFAFGAAFEVPVATVLLVRTGMVKPESLAEKRPYIIVGAFVLGMLLTPPDVISQTLLAVPILLLFEVGIFLSKHLKTSPEEGREDLENSTQTGSKGPVEQEGADRKNNTEASGGSGSST